MFGTSYNRYDNSPYRREQSPSVQAHLRNGLGLTAFADFASFQGSRDELFSIGASYPLQDPLNNVAVNLNWGHEAGPAYRTVSVTAARRLWRKMQLTLSHQRVNYTGLREQTILGMNYELNASQSISGRIFKQPNGQTNAYAAFSQKGNLGTEYYLIVGDPNAPTFRTSAILKVVVPFSIGTDPAKKLADKKTLN